MFLDYEKKPKQGKGAPGFEPGTSRSAVECSTTELYPRGFSSVQNDRKNFGDNVSLSRLVNTFQVYIKTTVARHSEDREVHQICCT